MVHIKNMQTQHTSFGGREGAGAGTMVVVVTAVVVVGTVTVFVTVVGGSCPPGSSCGVWSLCWAPAKRPMKTELSMSRARSKTSRILLRRVRGSCTMDPRRSENEG